MDLGNDDGSDLRIRVRRPGTGPKLLQAGGVRYPESVLAHGHEITRAVVLYVASKGHCVLCGTEIAAGPEKRQFPGCVPGVQVDFIAARGIETEAAVRALSIGVEAGRRSRCLIKNLVAASGNNCVRGDLEFFRIIF
jgi:hypothetical protein